MRRRWRNVIVWGTALAATAVLGYWLIDDAAADQHRLRRIGDEARRARAEPPVILVPEPVFGATTSLEDLRRGFAEKAAAGRPSVPLPKVDLPEPEFESDSALAVAIESEVRHRWIVQALSRVGAEVPAYLEAVGIMAGHSHLAKLRDRYELDISLSQLQLVRLVRLLAAAGYEFRSWQPPYPDNGHFQGRAAAAVRYQAVFE